MHSKQQALARDPMREREEPARPTMRVNRAGASVAAEGLRIGDVASRTRTVTVRDIELFTELTGDRNPVHYDSQLARRSRFGGIVVQGGVTSGLLNAVVAEDLPGPGSVFLHVDWRFLAPVRPGDVLTAEVRVLRVRADKPVTTLATTVRTGDGVLVVDGTAVVWRDPTVQGASRRPAPTGVGSRPH